MCTHYVTPDQAEIERYWQIGRATPIRWVRTDLFPRQSGPFIRKTADAGGPQLVVGQWALVPWFATTKTPPYSTVNARIETVATAAAFKQAWSRGQRCIVPVESFWEPCWESGRNVWWSFRRADGEPWGLAGLWNTWIDRATGEVVDSYTLLTQNADAHPLMSRMHKPDPKKPPDRQDKRSIVAIERGDCAQWLEGTVDEARALIRLTPAEAFASEAVTETAAK